MAVNKKINNLTISTSAKEPSRPKITSDIIATYLDLMGGQATLVKPDGSQYNPDRKGRVMIGDRMTTAEKFGQAGDIGLNNDFTKLPEVHARFDDRMTALQVQKEIATGKLTTQKFFELPSKEIANQAADEIRRSADIKLERGEIIDVRPLSQGYEVVAVKQYQPIPSRGNTLVRTYNLNNDPAGTFVGFNKPEEAYSAPKSLKELQGEIRSQQKQLTSAYKELNVSPDMTKVEYLRAIKPMQNELAADENLRTKAKLVLDDIRARTPDTVATSESPRSPLTDYVKQQMFAPPTMGEKALQQIQDHAIAPDAQTRINNTARDTGGYANAVGEPFNPPRTNVKPVDISQPRFAAEMGLATNPTGLTDRGYYNRVAATHANDDFNLGDRLKPFPDFYDLKRQSVAEGVRDEAFQNYIKGKANAPLIESGIMKAPELPMTARLGQEYISPKTGAVGTVESVGKKGVKLNVDGQVVPVEYKTLERLKYTGNKDFGFSTPAALRPVVGGFAGGTIGSMAFKQLAKAAGLNEDQQNIAAGVGGVTGALTGGSLSLFKPTTELKLPTPQQFARNVMGISAVSDSGMFLSSEGRNNMRLNNLNQYDVKPVLGEAAVIATDMLTPHPYGIATVPAARMAAESWRNNYDAIAERGLTAMKTTAAGATSAIKDFTYQTLSQLGRSAGLPFPMTEQAVGQVLDAIPNSQQIMGMGDRAKARLSRRYSTESGMVMSAGDRPQALTDLQRKALEFNQQYESGAIAKETYSNKRVPIQKLSMDQAAANMGMSPQEFAKFQENAYKEFPVKTESPKGSGKPPKYVEPSRFATDSKTGDRFDMQSLREANTEWRRLTGEASKPLREAYDQAIKSGDREMQKAAIEAMDELKSNLPPAPVKADYLAPLDKPVKIGDRKVLDMGAMSESAMDVKRSQRVQSDAPMTGYQRKFGLLDEATGQIVKPKSGFMQLVDNVTESLFQPKKSSGGFGKSAQLVPRSAQPAKNNFIAESAIEITAKSSGATTSQVKAQIANQRSAGIAPDLNLATEAIKQKRSLQGVTLPNPVMQLSGLTESKPFNYELPAADFVPLKNLDKVDPRITSAKAIGDRVNKTLTKQYGRTGIAPFMDTAQAAQVLTESVSRGDNAPTALSRAGLSVGAGYLATGLASFIPNTYVRTAAQLIGGIGAVNGTDKAIDQVVGRNEAKEQKYAKDLSRLDLQTTDEKQQWKPFANDSSIAAAYGNSLAAQFQSNLDYRPAARSLANLTNRDAIENARYQSERDTSIKAGMDAKSNKSIAFEDRGDGTTVGYIRNRGYNATESRVLALQNLANEHGYETPRTGKFDGKTLEALEKLGYSQAQITEYLQGKSDKAIGKPRQVENARSAIRQALANRSGEKVTSQQLSAALSAQRKAEGLKFGESLSESAVAGAFQSLAGKSLTELRQSPIKSKPLQRFGAAVGIGR
jgi:hypothetical protein